MACFGRRRRRRRAGPSANLSASPKGGPKRSPKRAMIMLRPSLCASLSAVLLAGLLAAGAQAAPVAAAGGIPVLSARAAGQQAALDRLYAALAAATSERDARAIENEIWRLWMVAPDAETGRLVTAAMRKRETYDFAGAHELLDAAVKRAPGLRGGLQPARLRPLSAGGL